MKLRTVLEWIRDGRIDLDRAEDEILYNCDEVTYNEEPDDGETDNEPISSPTSLYEQTLTSVEQLPPAERAQVIAALKLHLNAKK